MNSTHFRSAGLSKTLPTHGFIENRDSNRISQVNFTHFSIGGSVRKIVDRRSRKDKFSRGLEKSISVAMDRRDCRDDYRSSM